MDHQSALTNERKQNAHYTFLSMIDLKARAEALKRELAEKAEVERLERIAKADEIASTSFEVIDYNHYKTHRSLAALPIFSPTKTVSFEELNYTSGDGKTKLKVIPSVSYGRPTIYDHDVWLFVLDRVANAYRATGAIPSKISFTFYECLTALGKTCSGRAYNDLEKTFDRLATVSLQITVVGGGMNIGLCRYTWEEIERDDRKIGNRRMILYLDPTMKEHFEKTPHLFLAPPNYRLSIDLDRPLAKQMVTILRPRLGNQAEMPAMKWDTLQEMLGYRGRPRDFRRDVLAAMPYLDFGLRIEGEGKAQKLIFFNR